MFIWIVLAVIDGVYCNGIRDGRQVFEVMPLTIICGIYCFRLCCFAITCTSVMFSVVLRCWLL